MKNYSFNEFIEDINFLSKKISSFSPDCIVAIARGGLTIGHFLAEKMDIREIYTINAISYEKDKKLKEIKIFNIPDLKNKKKVLLVDDISDSGDTLEKIINKLKKIYPSLEIKTATIFYKKTSKVIPDFKVKEAKEWINFFWENQIKEN